MRSQRTHSSKPKGHWVDRSKLSTWRCVACTGKIETDVCQRLKLDPLKELKGHSRCCYDCYQKQVAGNGQIPVRGGRGMKNARSAAGRKEMAALSIVIPPDSDEMKASRRTEAAEMKTRLEDNLGL